MDRQEYEFLERIAKSLETIADSLKYMRRDEHGNLLITVVIEDDAK